MSKTEVGKFIVPYKIPHYTKNIKHNDSLIIYRIKFGSQNENENDNEYGSLEKIPITPVVQYTPRGSSGEDKPVNEISPHSPRISGKDIL